MVIARVKSLWSLKNQEFISKQMRSYLELNWNFIIKLDGIVSLIYFIDLKRFLSCPGIMSLTPAVNGFWDYYGIVIIKEPLHCYFFKKWPEINYRIIFKMLLFRQISRITRVVQWVSRCFLQGIRINSISFLLILSRILHHSALDSHLHCAS